MNWSFPVANHVLRLEVPEGWRNTSDATAISFHCAAEKATLTISVHARSEVDEAAVEQLDANAQPFGVPTSDKRPLRLLAGTGFARDFKKQLGDVETLWLAHFLFLADTTIIGSVHAPTYEMAKQRPVFSQILDSIAFVRKEPDKRPTNPAAGP